MAATQNSTAFYLKGVVIAGLAVNAVGLWLYQREVNLPFLWDKVFPWVSVVLVAMVLMGLFACKDADQQTSAPWGSRIMVTAMFLTAVAVVGLFVFRGPLAMGFVEDARGIAAKTTLKNFPWLAPELSELYSDALTKDLLAAEDRQCAAIQEVMTLCGTGIASSNSGGRVLASLTLASTCRKTPELCEALSCAAGPLPWTRANIEATPLLSGALCGSEAMGKAYSGAFKSECFKSKNKYAGFELSPLGFSALSYDSHMSAPDQYRFYRAMLKDWCDWEAGRECSPPGAEFQFMQEKVLEEFMKENTGLLK